MAGHMRRVALVGPTAADVRDTMVEGESGLMAVCERYNFRPLYEPSKRRLTFPNGATATTYSADEPNRLRGPQSDGAWADECGAWRYPDAFDQLQFGLRLGKHPRQVVTTTPKPVQIVRTLVKQAAEPNSEVVITRGSTQENAHNLAPSFLTAIEARYAGTRLGRQELNGELLEDVEGALWTLSVIDEHRIKLALGLDQRAGALAEMRRRSIDLSRLVVAVDPPITSTGAECGISVSAKGSDQRGYVLDDRSKQGTPNEWGTAAIAAFDDWQADAVVIEINQGGDMVENTLRTIRPNLPIKRVHASRGKATRAEPISALYEQGRISHVGFFPSLEDQMTQWVQGEPSPDRMDALVWGLTDLAIDPNYQWSDYNTSDLAAFLSDAGAR